MANAVRKICTKIGNGHQYLLGTSKTSTNGIFLLSDIFQQPPAGLQVEKKCKLNFVDNVFRQSQPLLAYIGQPVENIQSVVLTAKWHDGHTNKYNSIPPITNLNSTMSKPDNLPSPNHNNGTSNPKGSPSAEQLKCVYDKLEQTLPQMFKENLDYSLFHSQLIFENNIRGTKTVGLQYFMTTVSILRLMGHIKYAFVKFDILKITRHPEDGTVKVRWRIKGISGIKVFMKFWKFRLWNLEQIIKENIEAWHDGFSIFYVGSDGLVHKLTADKMQPDNDPVIEEKNPLATKLALFLGLTPQLNNLDCLMTFDSEQTNELLKMVKNSLDDVI